MMKLLAFVCLAGWLILESSVLISASGPLPSGESGFGGNFATKQKMIPEKSDGMQSRIKPLPTRWLAAVKDALEDTKCTEVELRIILVDLLTTHNEMQDALIYKLMKDYFALYLRKCGFEKRFKTAIFERKISTANDDSPLASYLLGESLQQTHEATANVGSRISFALNTVNQLLIGSDELDEQKHNNERQVSRINSLEQSTGKPHYNELNRYINGAVSAESLDALEFKMKARKFIPDKAYTWAYIKRFVELMESEIEAKYEDCSQVNRSKIAALLPSITRDYRGSKRLSTEHAFETDHFVRDFKANCTILWDHMYESMGRLAHNSALPTRDNEIRDFMNYLGYCSFVKLDPEKDFEIDTMLLKMDVPQCPRKATSAL